MRFRPQTKRDGNHKAVERALRDAGCEVFDSSGAGFGFPDLVVRPHRFQHVLLVEVKDGRLSPSRRKLTPMEADFASRFPVLVVLTPQDAVTQVLGGPHV